MGIIGDAKTHRSLVVKVHQYVVPKLVGSLGISKPQACHWLEKHRGIMSPSATGNVEN